MRSKLLGLGGPRLSVIGFGAWEIGIDASVTAQEQAVRAIQAGVDAGMNWIDTAEFYGMGLSEQLVARALIDRPDVMVFSKIWHKLHGGLTPQEVRRGAESTLARLRRDTIDLYLIVEPDPLIPVEKTWEAMAGLVDQGLARFIGIANFTPDLVQRCEAVRHVDAIQDQCSLLVRDRYDLLRSHCDRHSTAFLAYGPLALGLLAGKVDPNRSFSTTSWGRGKTVDELSSYQRSLFGPDVLPGHLRLVERLRPVAERAGIPLAQLALAWVVGRDDFTVAITGSTSPENVAMNAAAGDVELSREVVEKLTAWSAT
jgi:aryl-alcohol dehydrogenase-like predicted oxidoreductase